MLRACMLQRYCEVLFLKLRVIFIINYNLLSSSLLVKNRFGIVEHHPAALMLP